MTLPEDYAEPAQGVWPENAEAVRAFLRIGSQWRYRQRPDGAAIPVALDYPAVEAGLRLAGIEIDAECWARIQVIEAGALEQMREQLR